MVGFKFKYLTLSASLRDKGFKTNVMFQRRVSVLSMTTRGYTYVKIIHSFIIAN